GSGSNVFLVDKGTHEMAAAQGSHQGPTWILRSKSHHLAATRLSWPEASQRFPLFRVFLTLNLQHRPDCLSVAARPYVVQRRAANKLAEKGKGDEERILCVPWFQEWRTPVPPRAPQPYALRS